VWRRRLSRRALLGLGGGALASALLPATIAQASERRIGVVLPWARDEFRLSPHSVEMAGNSARKGAVLAEEEWTDDAGGSGATLLLASAPDASAAERAARRLASTDEVLAVVGGLGEEQACAIGRVAQEEGFLFFNIGSASAFLRTDRRNRYSFHVEASARTYLAALVRWFDSSGPRRWFLVRSGDPKGLARYELARREIAESGGEAYLAGSAAVNEPGEFNHLFAAIRDSAPDLVLLLLDWREQLEFLARFDAAGLSSTVTGFPDPVSQTYRFATALQQLAPRTALGHRVSLWSPALGSGDAKRLNERFFSRWGVPMDSPAWSAYQAVSIANQVLTRTPEGGVEAIEHLERETTVFDIDKGIEAAFGPSDHQLRQPLYMVAPSSPSPGGSVLPVVAELPGHDTAGSGWDEVGGGRMRADCGW
jgi:ABC-type branched-subunit amino acid transport system substrate-binding protein